VATERELLSFVGEIYEAAADPVRWRDIAPTIARAFVAASAAICVIRRQPVPSFAIPSATANFDSWALSMLRDHDAQTGDTPGFAQSDPPDVDIGHVLGAIFDVSDDLTASLGIHRNRGAERFDPDDRHKLGLFLPHLQRALQIRSRLEGLEHGSSLSLEILDGLAIAAIVTDQDCRILFANSAAERSLRDAVVLTASQGQLRTQDPRRGGSLRRAIADAAATSGGTGTSAGDLVNIPRESGAPLVLLVSPLRAANIGFGPSRPAALVLFSTSEEAAVSEPRLADAYGLTPAEARLLSALVAGHGLTDYASGSGISINTAKTHMRNVFQKMGHNRQVDVVRAVLADPLLKLGGPKTAHRKIARPHPNE
jgi:DNA-binding CsgD family transcriptional regulator